VHGMYNTNASVREKAHSFLQSSIMVFLVPLESSRRGVTFMAACSGDGASVRL
jgi:hypothetical protein